VQLCESLGIEKKCRNKTLDAESPNRIVPMSRLMAAAQ
jgi:hypothetical protein